MEEPVEVQARTRIQSALNKHSKKALIIQSSAVHLTAKNWKPSPFIYFYLFIFLWYSLTKDRMSRRNLINPYYLPDVDECSINTHDCDAHAICTNTEGSFTCKCNKHFIGDGKTCTPIKRKPTYFFVDKEENVPDSFEKSTLWRPLITLLESWYKEPLYNEVLGITKDFLYPSDNKIYGKEPWYSGTSIY